MGLALGKMPTHYVVLLFILLNLSTSHRQALAGTVVDFPIYRNSAGELLVRGSPPDYEEWIKFKEYKNSEEQNADIEAGARSLGIEWTKKLEAGELSEDKKNQILAAFISKKLREKFLDQITETTKILGSIKNRKGEAGKEVSSSSGKVNLMLFKYVTRLPELKEFLKEKEELEKILDRAKQLQKSKQAKSR